MPKTFSTLVILLLCSAMLFAPAMAFAQASGQPFYSPTQIGMNAITLPGTGSTALSEKIFSLYSGGATIDFSCTQGAISLTIQTYAEDGSTASGAYSVLTAVAASTQTEFFFGEQGNPASTSGTLGTVIRLPQRAFSFKFTNASASAGTCTARVFLN